jgi:serine/threonine protein kinase
VESLLGTIVDERYEVESFVGSGGNATVYKARQSGFDRIVALKFIKREMLNEPGAVSRFEQEAEILSQLRHKNLPTFYGYGQWQGRYYLATEYVNGKSLRELLANEEPLDTALTLHVIRLVCAALSCAHAHGIVHRDISGGNVMLIDSENGDAAAVGVKLIDFGLAKNASLSVVQKLTQDGSTVGTVSYMSPEQCMGKGVDARSDIYSTACLLFHCLTGVQPFSGVPMVIMAHHIATDLPQLCEYAPSLNEAQRREFQDIIELATAKNPALRMGSIDELDHRLAAIESGSYIENTNSKGSAASLVRVAGKHRYAWCAGLLFFVGGALCASSYHPNIVKTSTSPNSFSAMYSATNEGGGRARLAKLHTLLTQHDLPPTVRKSVEAELGNDFTDNEDVVAVSEDVLMKSDPASKNYLNLSSWTSASCLRFCGIEKTLERIRYYLRTMESAHNRHLQHSTLHVLQAELLCRNGDYSRAATVIADAMKRFPDHMYRGDMLKLWAKYKVLSHEQPDVTKLIAHVDRKNDSTPFGTLDTDDCISLASGVVECSFLSGEPNEKDVAKLFQACLERAPSQLERGRILYAMAGYYAGNGDYEKSANAAESALLACPNGRMFAGTLLRCIYAESKCGRPKRALEIFEQSLKPLNKDDRFMIEVNFVDYLAMIHARAGDLKEAVRILIDAQKDKGQTFELKVRLLDLALYYMAKTNPDAAVKFLDLTGDAEKQYAMKITLPQRLGLVGGPAFDELVVRRPLSVSKALDDWHRAVSEWPAAERDKALALIAIGQLRCRAELDSFADLEKPMTIYMQSNSFSVRQAAVLQLISYYYNLKDWDSMQRVATKALQRDPDKIDLLLYCAEAHCYLGHRKESIASFRKAIGSASTYEKAPLNTEPGDRVLTLMRSKGFLPAKF